MGQGRYDLLFGAYLVKYIPSEEERPRYLENVLKTWGTLAINFSSVKKSAAKKEAQAATKAEAEASSEETSAQED